MRLAVILAATLMTSACGASISDPVVRETGTDASSSSGGDDTSDPGTDAGSATGSGSGSGSDPTPALTGTQYANDSLVQFCTEVFACKATYPTNASVTFADAYGASAGDCAGGYEDYFGTSHIDGDVANGKIHFNAADAQACLSGTTAPACSTFWQAGISYPAACDTAIVGTVADGGECNTAYECSAAQEVCPNRVCVVAQ